jgi:DNA-binding MarR family transcriptional regulator
MTTTTIVNKAFESHSRLRIVAALVVAGDWVDFMELKKKLEITDGNLGAHIVFLEKEQYIETRKQAATADKRSITSYRITATGKQAAKQFLRSLDVLFDR